MGTNTEDAEEVLANALDKRNLAALAKNNFFPREYKRSQDTGNFHIKTIIILCPFYWIGQRLNTND